MSNFYRIATPERSPKLKSTSSNKRRVNILTAFLQSGSSSFFKVDADIHHGHDTHRTMFRSVEPSSFGSMPRTTIMG